MPREFKVNGIKEANPNAFGGMVSRASDIDRKKVDFEKGIETIATTEAPALVVDWERWQIVREVLPMRYMESPNDNKVPLLDSHSRFAIEQVKGSARNFRVSGEQLLCECFVSEAEPAIRQKIKEGHIERVSIGYRTEGDYTVEIPKGANVTIDGVAYKNEFDDGYPFLVRTWWKTHELSLVAIGADEAAKFKSITDGNQKKFFDKLAEQASAIEQLRSEIMQMKEPRTIRDIKKELVMKLTIMKHELKLN